MTNPILAKLASLPKTHAVVTVWANGVEARYEAHSAASAENYALRMRRAIGGEAISVEVVAI